MKKIIAILLTTVLIFTFAGCSSFSEGISDGYNEAVSEN